jgi:hypothetical protein
MSTTTAIRPSVRAAFEGLIDYAGLFPPATLPLEEARRQYQEARHEDASWILGRFIVPASRVCELGVLQQTRAPAEPTPLSVIVDGSLDPRQWFASVQGLLAAIGRVRESVPSLRVHALEVPLAPLSAARETFDAAIGQLGALVDVAGLHDLPVYVELPGGKRWRELLPGGMAALARAGLNAKLRCGGVTESAFPPVADVAAFIATAAAEGVAFKATAGLHHPVRHVDASTGFTMHGFLNLLGAAALAPRFDLDALLQIVAEEDVRAFAFDDTTFAWRDRCVNLDDLRSTRACAFAGYGSCSFDEPIADLTALGLFSPAA